MKLILPKTFVEKSVIGDLPLFFLAGPVRGGGDWQKECCVELTHKMPIDFFVVVPYRWEPEESWIFPLARGENNKFPRQTAWEHHYLTLASEKSRIRQGCIIFWLPCESKAQPRDDGQPYARDTYGELGRWGRNAAIFPGSHIVVGAESEFPGLSVIRENFRLDLGSDTFPIFQSLKETVAQAVQFVAI